MRVTCFLCQILAEDIEMGRACNTYGREVNTIYWEENLKERDH
jgi:hypothetical protein